MASGKSWLFLTVSLAPTILFYGQGLLFNEVLRTQAEVSFLPHLWLKPHFWQFWLKHIYGVVGFAALVGALLGVLLVSPDWRRALMFGLWGGYLAYGLIFTYHIHTHNYYQLPLIPIVALSLGVLGAAVLHHVIRSDDGLPRRIIVVGIFGIAVLLHLGLFIRFRQELPNFTHEIKFAEEIGAFVDHSIRTVSLAAYGGRPLHYHGEFAGAYWPDLGEIRASKLWGEREMNVQERLAALSSKRPPKYFIVTDFKEFEAQSDLRQFLTTHFTTIVENSHYVIFNIQENSRMGQ